MDSSTRERLESVATGLGLVYTGLCLLVISALTIPLAGLLSQQLGITPDTMVYIFYGTQSLMALAIVLDLIGRFCCLRVRAEDSLTKPIVFLSVILTLGGLLLTALLLIPRIREMLPKYLFQLQLSLAVTGAVLFVLFLRIIAERVGSKSLALQAIVVLILGIVLVVGIVGLTTTLLSDQLGAAQNIGGLEYFGLAALGIVVLIMYGNLLTNLGRAIKSYATNQTQQRSGVHEEERRRLARAKRIDDDDTDRPRRRPARAKPKDDDPDR